MSEQEEVNTAPRRRLWPWIAGTLAAFCVLAVVALVALHAMILRREWTFEIDLEDSLPEDVLATVTNHAVSVHVKLDRHQTWDYIATGGGKLLDWPFSLVARLNYSLTGLSANGACSVVVNGTSWRADAKFSWSWFDGWSADIAIPDAEFNGDDAFIGDIARRLASLAEDVESLDFSGRARFEAHASKPRDRSDPVWSADAWLADTDASCKSGETGIAVKNFQIHAGATGIGEHVDIKPAFPRAASLDIGGISLSNAFLSVRSTETAFLATEAGADIWGGSARLYSCFLSRERLAAGFTLFLDGIDTEKAVSTIAGFDGTATGELHGKLPLKYDGDKLTIGEAYLYSTPGEKGTLQIRDSSAFVDRLAYAGVSEEDRRNMVRVLADMTYNALKLDLRREENGSHALRFKLEGSATDGKVTVPASFNVTYHGDIPYLINAGLRAAQLEENLRMQ